MEISPTIASLKLQLFLFSLKIPSLTGEMLILLCPSNRDGELKPKRGEQQNLMREGNFTHCSIPDLNRMRNIPFF